jgi:hypothetical protein
LAEQLDKHDGPQTSKLLKKMKHKEERAKLKQELKNGEDPVDTYGRYKGWWW